MYYTILARYAGVETIRHFDNTQTQARHACICEDTSPISVQSLKNRIKDWVHIPNIEFHTYIHNCLFFSEDNFYGYYLNQFCKGDVVLVEIENNSFTYFEDPNDLMMLKLKA